MMYEQCDLNERRSGKMEIISIDRNIKIEPWLDEVKIVLFRHVLKPIPGSGSS